MRVIGSYATDLEGRLPSQRHNAENCLRKIGKVTIPPGQTFSFNDAVGSWSRDQGYRRAPVSYNGNLVDSWGGGVCQTSTTLYNAALLGGLEIIERHAHHHAPNYVPPGRDAAVAYPNIDLVIRNPYSYPVVLQGKSVGGRLVYEVAARGPGAGSVSVMQRVTELRKPQEFVLGSGPFGRVRNPGKSGYEVETFRLINGRRERLSHDNYPVMHRVVEYR